MLNQSIPGFDKEWLTNVPELETRFVLQWQIVQDKTLRKTLFRAVNYLEAVANIPNKSIALICTRLMWNEIRKNVERQWLQRLRIETGNDVCFGELHGCIRNVYNNMRIKIGDNWNWPKCNGRNIKRNYL